MKTKTFIQLLNGRSRIVIVTLALLFIMAGLTAANYSMRSRTVVIADVTQPWQHHFSNPIGALFDGYLRIIVRGHLNGSAKVSCAGEVINLSSGDIDAYIDQAEYWGSVCDVRYEPVSVTSGQLSVRAIIGWTTDWSYTKPTLDEQGPANYTGGWFTLYPNSDQKYCD